MRKQDKKKNGLLNGPGFYIALCCCVLAIGLVGYFNESNNKSKTPTNEEGVFEVGQLTESATPSSGFTPTLPPSVQEAGISTPAPAATPGATPVEFENSIPEDMLQSEIVDKEPPVQEAAAPKVLEEPSFINPVDGKALEAFSGDSLVYNTALEDWRTHNGIDFAAAEGTEVKVSCDGVIEEIFSDSLGESVLIDHQNGYKTKYANLASTEGLNAGDTVAQSQTIGVVGSTALENVAEPHLHFELWQDNIPVNPADYLKNK
jgi:murein DD-endopeptidase MepM/ murein hydrolase activator NlpD